MEKLNVALIGCGTVARELHIPAILADPRLKLYAVVDVEEGRANKIAKRHGAKASTSYAEFLEEDATNIVVITLPNELHFKVAKKALTAEKHVLIEKPMTTHAKEAERLVEIANSKNLHLGVVHNKRYVEAYAKAKGLLMGGIIGEPYHISLEAQIMGPYRCWAPSSDWFYREKGGVLLDQGSHIFDLARYITGDEFTNARGYLYTFYDEDDPVMEAYGTLNGKMTSATYQLSWTCDTNRDFVMISGTAGNIYIDREREVYLDRNIIEETIDQNKRFLSAAYRKLITKKNPENSHRALYKDFIDNISGIDTNYPNGNDGLRSLEILEKVKQGSEFVKRRRGPESKQAGL